MRTAVLQHNAQNVWPAGRKGVVERKGGVCFEVDTRQFKGGPERVEARRKKRRSDPNSREQLIIRRETAKRYDREARVRLFGFA